MVYPDSPFMKDFNPEFLLSGVINIDDEKKNAQIQESLKWLCKTPNYTSFRVNALNHDVNDVLKMIKEKVSHVSSLYNKSTPNITIHPVLNDVILVQNWDPPMLKSKEKHVIVDIKCAEAVLRGSNIFAPGVKGMSKGIHLNDEVSVYVDIDKKCKKGAFDIVNGRKELIAIGKVKIIRHTLFKENVNSGVAVEILCSKFGCIPLESNSIKSNIALLQNIPSTVCSIVLNPKPGETVLDMCASPGNKTTHLATLMRNEGILVAIDKTTVKVNQLKENCDFYGAKVHVFQADSTTILNNNIRTDDVTNGPPFKCESFDKILLDAPCSALGKRPQLHNVCSKVVLESHIPLQRKLFETAVQLLKTGGVLVYSTCSIALAENEALVAWALHKFPFIKLEICSPHLGGIGLQCSGLTNADCLKLQRFDQSDNVNSIGFFIAKFKKY